MKLPTNSISIESELARSPVAAYCVKRVADMAAPAPIGPEAMVPAQTTSSDASELPEHVGARATQAVSGPVCKRLQAICQSV